MFIYNFLVNKIMMSICFSKCHLLISTYTKFFQKHLDIKPFPNEWNITESLICRCGNKLIMNIFQRMFNMVVFMGKYPF